MDETMSQTYGKMLKCDWCGTKIFLKERKASYESVPDGWKTLDKTKKDLCPDCASRYDGLIEKAFEKV